MARPKDLSDPDARRRLKVRREPYWYPLIRYGYVGYYKSRLRGYWRARWHDEEQALKQVPDGDYAAAVREARRYFLSFTEPEMQYKGSLTVGDVCRSHAVIYKAEKRTGEPEDRSGDIDSRLAHVYSRKLDSVPVDVLTREHLVAWRLELLAAGLSPDTVNRYFADVRSALNRGYENKNKTVPSADAWHKLPSLKSRSRRRDDYMEPQDRSSMTVSASKRSGAFADLLVMFQLTGGRPKELRTMKVEQVDMRKRCITLLSRKGDGTLNERYVYFEPEFDPLFARLIVDKRPGDLLLLNQYGRRWTGSYYTREWRKARDAAGVSAKFGAYDIRHATVADWADSGQDLQSVSKASGHSLAILDKYYSKRRERAGRELAKVRTVHSE